MQTGDYLNNTLGFYVIEDCKRKSELKYYLENKQVILYSTTYD